MFVLEIHWIINISIDLQRYSSWRNEGSFEQLCFVYFWLVVAGELVFHCLHAY